MARKRNPTKAQHRKAARKYLAQSDEFLETSAQELARGDVSDGLYSAASALASASLAACDAANAGDDDLLGLADSRGRIAGALIVNTYTDLLGSSPTRRMRMHSNPPRSRHPAGKPKIMIRTYSTAILSGNNDIYLIINDDGEVIDAVVTEFEDFTPIEKQGYGELSILELDVSAAQYRKLKKLSDQLQKLVEGRPVFRPGKQTGTIDRWPRAFRPATNNPTKRKLKS